MNCAHRTRLFCLLLTIALGLGLGCAKFNDSCPVTTPEVWGEIGVDLDIRRKYIRQCEAPVGNFLADALLNYDYNLQYEGQDVVVTMGLINSGAIRDRVTCGDLGDTRDRIPQGPVTDQDLFQLLPFYEDSVVVVRMDVDSLTRVLERSVSALGIEGGEGQEEGYFMQVAGQRGVRVDLDCSGTAQTLDTSGKVIVTEGTRISGICVGDPCEPPPGIIYVATLDFVVGESADGVPNDGFVGFHDPSVEVLETFLPVIDVVRPWLAGYARDHGLDPSVYPAVEGRLNYQASCEELSSSCGLGL